MPRHLYVARSRQKELLSLVEPAHPRANAAQNHKRNLCTFVTGLASSFGMITLFSINSYALSPNVQLRLGDPITVTRADGSSSDTLNPGSVDDGTGTSVDKGYGHYQIPIDLTILDSAKYSIYIAGDTSLIGKSTEEAISTVSAALPLATFRNTNNVWGYRWTLTDRTATQNEIDNLLNASSILPMPATSTLGTSDSQLSNPDGGDGSFSTENDRNVTKKLTLEFAANVDGNKSSDNYSGNVTVSVVASPIEATLFDITYMQEMTHDICDATPTPTKNASTPYANKASTWNLAQKKFDISDTSIANFDDFDNTTNYPETVLLDTRDQKPYLIRKLADGKCWMSQNLEFDFVDNTGQNTQNEPAYYDGISKTSNGYWGGSVVSDSFKLTDADTDLNSTTIWTPSFVKSKHKLTVGKYFFQNLTVDDKDITDDDPRIITASIETPIGLPVYVTQVSQGNGLFATDGNSIRSFSIAGFSSDYAFSVPTGNRDANGYMQFENSNTGEPYQRRGNLYNWSAATLGSGIELNTATEAADSICPKGWRLPGLLDQSSVYRLSEVYAITGNDANAMDAFSSAPLSYNRTGWINSSTGIFQAFNSYGGWWTIVGLNSEQARLFFMEPGSVVPLGSSYKTFKYAVRCVAR